MGFSTLSCSQFVDELSSKKPVPGGGAASALAGAVGTALGNMVGSLTVGKKKYAAVEEEMYDLKAKCDFLQKELLALTEKDAVVFQPLAQAYQLPSGTEEEKKKKAETMEVCLRNASQVPLKIMEKCCMSLDLMKEFAARGSKMAVSDAVAGAALCRAGLQGAALNVYINTRPMRDRACAEQYNRRADEMLQKYIPLADDIVSQVEKELKAQ